MSIEQRELFQSLMHLCKVKELQAALYDSPNGRFLTGAAAILGGLLLDKEGFEIGKAIGEGATDSIASNFKPVWVVLRDLTDRQKHSLIAVVTTAFKNVGIKDLVTISSGLLSDVSFQNIAIDEITNFLQGEMKIRIL